MFLLLFCFFLSVKLFWLLHLIYSGELVVLVIKIDID